MWRQCDVQRFHEHWMLKWSWIRDLNMFVELSVCVAYKQIISKSISDFSKLKGNFSKNCRELSIEMRSLSWFNIRIEQKTIQFVLRNWLIEVYSGRDKTNSINCLSNWVLFVKWIGISVLLRRRYGRPLSYFANVRIISWVSCNRWMFQ